MPNMKHCRFENTYNDLQDCYTALANDGGVAGVESGANQYEREYVRKLVSLCQDIAEEFGNMDDND